MSRAVFCLLVVCAAISQAQAPSEVFTVEIGGRFFAYTVQDGFAVTQGDIILGRAEDVENAESIRPGPALRDGYCGARLDRAASSSWALTPVLRPVPLPRLIG